MNIHSLSLVIGLALLAAPAGAWAQGKSKPEPAEPLAGTEKDFDRVNRAPVKAIVPVEADNVLDLDLSTGGRVRIQLRPDIAPGHVERVKALARQGFYNGVLFHRVIEGFMAQTGDPKGDGTGGSTLPDLKAEFNTMPHLRGTLSMARAASEDSANSQFFIMLLPRMQLDRKYTVFGRVIEGMQYVDAVARGEPPATPSRIVQASIESDNRPMPTSLNMPVAPPSPKSAPLPAMLSNDDAPSVPNQN